MAHVIYATQMSLDGYTADRDGSFDWGTPTAELHAGVNEVMAGIGTLLLGRRMWEVMRVWDLLDLEGEPDEVAGFARMWRGADKVVHSRTLEPGALADAPRTRLERTFDPDAVRALAASADRDLGVAGAGLASLALAAGLVDEVAVWVHPVVVGGGTAAFGVGADGAPLRLDLELVETRRYDGGVVGMRYRPQR